MLCSPQSCLAVAIVSESSVPAPALPKVLVLSSTASNPRRAAFSISVTLAVRNPSFMWLCGLLSLDGARCQPLDKLALHQDVDDDHRQRANGESGKDLAPLRSTEA